jgi:hypothetical protein
LVTGANLSRNSIATGNLGSVSHRLEEYKTVTAAPPIVFVTHTKRNTSAKHRLLLRLHDNAILSPEEQPPREDRDVAPTARPFYRVRQVLHAGRTRRTVLELRLYELISYVAFPDWTNARPLRIFRLRKFFCAQGWEYIHYGGSVLLVGTLDRSLMATGGKEGWGSAGPMALAIRRVILSTTIHIQVFCTHESFPRPGQRSTSPWFQAGNVIVRSVDLSLSRFLHFTASNTLRT